jgi:signal transduction histidine kinase
MNTSVGKRFLKFSSKILASCILLLFLFSQNAISGNKVTTIVIFFAWYANLPAYHYMLEGFKSEFYEGNDEAYNLQIEYLDINRLQNRDYAKDIVDLYNEKYKETPIDLLISIGPWTYPVLKTYGLKALENTPTIAIENDNLISYALNSGPSQNFLEIKLKYNFSKTLKTAFDLFPNNKNVYIISGCSALDDYYLSLVKKGAKDFINSHHFIFITGISMDSTLQIAEKIPRNSIVFVPIYASDIKNVPFSTPEAVNIIANHSGAPVFPVFDNFIKRKGGIGGYVFSYTNVGKEIGKAARQMLNGKSANDITIHENSFYQNIYDWQQLKKWDLLDSKAIPSNSIFYNKDISFLSEYKWYLVGVLVFLLSQTLLIGYLIKLNRRQREVTKQKLETEILHRELIREDRISNMAELTASLSHELNQPLTAILYNAQAGKRFLKSGKLDLKQAEEIFDNIIDDDKRAGGIIGSVKSLMKLENRDMENVNLNSLILETVNIVHSDTVAQRIKLKLKLDTGPVFVYGDKIQLQQVLMNFIKNAAIAMENNDPENKILEIRLHLNKGSATVSIRDTGPGIDDSIKEKLFKPFVTTRKNGFGIGLTISRSIIIRHKGEIWADNIVDGGADFSFRLQIVKDE